MDKRLQTVKSYLELSFGKEDELNDLVYLASKICQTPIASVTFVDDKAQHPVIAFGNAVKSSCDVAFCNITIKQQTIFEIRDAQTDPRFVNNPLVRDHPYIRFYAGMPLITTDGFAIGSLCVIDQEPKKLEDHQVKGLEILAKQVMQRLEMRMSLKRLQESIKEVEQSQELLQQAEIMKTAFYDGSEDYFLLLNRRFEVISFNSSIQNLCEKRNNELQKGKQVLEYIKPANFAKVQQILFRARSGETTTFELLADADSQSSSWIKFTVSPAYNSSHELIGIACIGCNIDKEKQQQEQIRVQKVTLSHIAQLHSHQIRHPLTNILGIINILKQENFTMTEEYVGYLETASKELDDIIRKVVVESYVAA